MLLELYYYAKQGLKDDQILRFFKCIPASAAVNTNDSLISVDKLFAKASGRFLACPLVNNSAYGNYFSFVFYCRL